MTLKEFLDEIGIDTDNLAPELGEYVIKVEVIQNKDRILDISIIRYNYNSTPNEIILEP